LTIDAGLQSLAHDLLGGRIGAVVLLETGAGAVRTLASNPHVDPNGLVAVDLESATEAADYWAELQADPAQPLLNRATQGLYTPGSTFKTITASAAIEDGVATPQTVYTDDGDLEVDGHVIVEHNRPDDSIDEWTLEQGLAFSLNVVFAQVGLELGGDRLFEIAGKFGFGEEIPFDVEVATGQIASKRSFLDQPAAVADTAFGQGELLTTPLGMALVAAAIANEGEMMRPYLVDRITDVDGERMKSAEPGVWRRPIGASTAQTMRDLMVNTVENGYALAAAIDGLLVGGKTGTAETGETEPHAWFIGFAGDAAPTHAVAVLLEHGGTAVSESIAIAREMLRSAILG
jgi:peptidoglycan glycosyltransferase